MRVADPAHREEAKGQVLIVDDEPRNLSLMEAYLAPLGCELTFASGGREALELFEKHSYDLVVLDIMMPDMDGIDVLTHIRAWSSVSEAYTPVILVTALTERQARLRGFEAGADEFLVRPVDRFMLIDRVRTMLHLRKATRDLAVRNTMLLALQGYQRDFTSFLVHDLKNPISVIHTNLQLASEHISSAQPDIVNALEDMVSATTRLQSMVEDLLVIAKLEESDLPLQRSRICVVEFLEEMMRAHHREAEINQVELDVVSGQDLIVDADRSLLRRILDNILDNSIRHTPPSGHIRISASVANGVEICISNTGRPIPEQDRSHIFSKFARGADALSSRSGNVGLGLYFCKLAVEAHGGEIEVTQTPEFPTSFVVRLPSAAP